MKLEFEVADDTLVLAATPDQERIRGKRVAFTFNNSQVNTNYTLAYSNPYYTIDGISRGFRASYRKTDAGDANVTDYSTDVYGANVSFGMPLSDYDRLRFDDKATSRLHQPPLLKL